MFRMTRKRFLISFVSIIVIVFIATITIAFYKRSVNKEQYDTAKANIESENYDKAIEELNGLEFEDSDLLLKYTEAKKSIASKEYEAAIASLTELGDFRDSKDQIVLAEYGLAIQYFNDKQYDEAKQLFKKLGDYEDSENYLQKIDKQQLLELTDNTYNNACKLFENKKYKDALENFSLILGYKDSQEKSEICKRYLLSHSISCGILNSFGITEDNTVLPAGDNTYNQRNTNLWKNIVSIDIYGEYTIGLTEDGTVKTSGNLTRSDQDYISSWQNVIDVTSGELYVAALMNDGTVVAAGHNGDGQCDVETWKNIIDIDAGWRFTVGLTQGDGLCFAGLTPSKMKIDYQKKDWKDVVAISASGGDPHRNDRGKGHVVGLTSDGHVIAIGDNSKGQCNVKDWKNVVKVVAGDWYTVALTKDGDVLITGENIAGSRYIEQEKLEAWTHIQDIAAGYGQVLVVKENGLVDAMGFNDKNKCSDAIAWTKKIRQ